MCHYAEFRYAECRDYLNVMLCVVMLSVVRLNAIILSVLAPKYGTIKSIPSQTYPVFNSRLKLSHKQKVYMVIITLEYDSLD